MITGLTKSSCHHRVVRRAAKAGGGGEGLGSGAGGNRFDRVGTRWRGRIARLVRLHTEERYVGKIHGSVDFDVHGASVLDGVDETNLCMIARTAANRDDAQGNNSHSKWQGFQEAKHRYLSKG